MEIILDVQGSKMPNNEFSVKELAAVKIQRDEKIGNGCMLFKQPFERVILPMKYKTQNLWCEHKYHGIPWNAGDIPYNELEEVFDILLKVATIIYVNGLEKKEWITNFVKYSIPIINLEDLGCPNLKQLNVAPYRYYEYHYNCSYENVQRLKIWYMQNSIGSPSIAKSLQIFYQLKSLKYMRNEDIACLSKDFILMFARNDIDEVWDKLPAQMQRDINIIGYRRCRKHHQTLNIGDDFDGPIPLRKNCPACDFSKEKKISLVGINLRRRVLFLSLSYSYDLDD